MIQKFSFYTVRPTKISLESTGVFKSAVARKCNSFKYITFVVPAAIGVYWIFKSVLSTIEHVILYKLMPMPKFTEEDFKAAEKELAGKNKNRPVKKERDPNVPRPRSLHHIDDEDYDEHGNYIALPEESEIKAEDTPVEIAPLKVDERLENKEDAEPKSEASEAESEDK